MLKTKKTAGYQNRRVTRVEPPAVEEAIAAAEGLTDVIEHQIEIASQLMGLPEDEIRPLILQKAAQKPAPEARHPMRMPVMERALTERSEGPKVVVVERRRPRVAVR
jgi:hypothetical protein